MRDVYKCVVLSEQVLTCLCVQEDGEPSVKLVVCKAHSQLLKDLLKEHKDYKKAIIEEVQPPHNPRMALGTITLNPTNMSGCLPVKYPVGIVNYKGQEGLDISLVCDSEKVDEIKLTIEEIKAVIKEYIEALRLL